ncbi:unnamed protein product, partial [Allacma fusca]
SISTSLLASSVFILGAITMQSTVAADHIKILVAGDTKGKFKELFDRVSTVNRKNGPFNLLLCVGDFFPDVYSEDLYIPPAPISTFILGPSKPSQLKYFTTLTGCEISDNITYLGQRGVYNDSHGLKIAYFSGSQSKTGEKTDVEFNYEDVKNFEVRVLNEVGFKGVDIFLTSQWPLGIENKTATLPAEPPQQSSNLISRLASSLKPRYHFAGIEGIHYERPPYRNHLVLAETAQHPTRFISLANVANTSKSKWLYAFNILPMKVMNRLELIKQPENITEFPFANVANVVKKEDASDGTGAAPANQFFYDTSYTGQPRGRGAKRHQEGRGGWQGKRGRDGPSEPRQPQKPCWFCLASPEVEKHLVVSIGDSAYVTLAKGGLTDDHVLILPIGHFQSTIECPQEVADEINKFKSCLKKFFASIGKGVVFFERNFKSPHLQVQAIPIPIEIAKCLKITCLDYADSEEIEMQDFPSNADLSQMTRVGFPYFYLELPDGSKLFTPIGKNFPIQFGRELLASEPILNCMDKVDWKACALSKDEEAHLTKSFREAFKSFDFTLS